MLCFDLKSMQNMKYYLKGIDVYKISNTYMYSREIHYWDNSMRKTFNLINLPVPKGKGQGFSTFYGIGMNTEIKTARVNLFAIPLVKIH